MANIPFMHGDFGMMHKKSMLAAALLAALLPASAARAETVFLGGFSKGAVPGIALPGDTGNETITVMGVWMESATTSGNTRLEIDLPEWASITGTLTPKIWSMLYGRARSNTLFGSDNTIIPLSLDVDYACGVDGLDIDPTTGEMYGVVGYTTGNPGSGDCDTGDRRLIKYSPAFGKFRWIGALGRVHNIEFLGDGRLLVESSSNGPNGRGAINEVNKSTAGLTYRTNPSVGNNFRDLVYNPGDSRLYAIERCYVIRINPADWSSTNYYRGELCSQRRVTAALLEDNHFIVRGDSYFGELVVNPADGSFVSFTQGAYHGNGWPRYPMVASKTDTGVAKSCTAESSRKVICEFGDIKLRGTVAVQIPIQYSVPLDALPGSYAGSIKWYRDSTLLGQQTLNSRVLADDVEVAISPGTGRYNVNDTFTLSVDVTASGGKTVNDVDIDIPLPSKVLTVTGISGASTCGLSRTGVSCTGISVPGDQTVTISVSLEATAAGSAFVQAVAEPAAGDVVPSNNMASATYVVGAATDLVAEGTEGGAGKIGAAMELEVSVSNEGPDAATNATLRFPGDAGFDIGTATTDLGTCAASGKDVLCSFGTIAVGVTSTVNVKVTPNRSGNLTLPVQASSGLLDVTPGNNTYAFAVSVPTLPFTIALGNASPSSSSGDVRSVLQLAITPDPKADAGVEISSISGSLKISDDGLALKQKVLVFEDVDANGQYDETDTFVGSGALSAEGNEFTVAFAKPITAPAKTTTNFIIAVQAEGAPRVAGVPFGGSSNNWVALALVAMLPMALAGFAFGRRRAGLAVLGLMAISLVGACSEIEDLLANAKVSATVTSVSATLLGDTGSQVEATGLPITGPTVTLMR